MTIQRVYKGRRTAAMQKHIQNYRDYLCEKSEVEGFRVNVPDSLVAQYGDGQVTLECNQGSRAGPPCAPEPSG